MTETIVKMPETPAKTPEPRQRPRGDLARILPTLVMRLLDDSGQILTALVILAHTKWITNTVLHPNNRIANILGCDQEYVDQVVDELVKLGILADTDQTSIHGQIVYRVQWPPDLPNDFTKRRVAE